MCFFDRVTQFYKRHGLGAFCRHAAVRLWRKIFVKPDVIYFADLASLSSPRRILSESCTVVEKNTLDSLSDDEVKTLGGYIGHKIFLHHIRKRFPMGASLWLLKKDNVCIGMIWTIIGNTIEPFYYLMGENDVHFFNNEIFKPYQGQGFNPGLIEYVLFAHKNKGCSRAYIETNLRNIPELRSLSKTSFKPVGKAIKLNFGRKRLTLWSAK